MSGIVYTKWEPCVRPLSDPKYPGPECNLSVYFYVDTIEQLDEWVKERKCFYNYVIRQSSKRGKRQFSRQYECSTPAHIVRSDGLQPAPEEHKSDAPSKKKRKTNSGRCKSSIVAYQFWPDIKVFDEQLNIDVTGKIKVTWNFVHDHQIGTISHVQSLPVLDKAKNQVMKAISGGASWSIVKQHIYQPDIHIPPGYFNEYEKITINDYYNWRRRFIKACMEKDKGIFSSLKQWGDIITSEGGRWDFYTSNSSTGQGYTEWSYSFMSEYQIETFKNTRNHKICFLDSTHNVGTGITKKDLCQLFTIIIKNSITGLGTPVAFMISNCLKAEIISRFLEFVSRCSGVTPNQVMIDCCIAEVAAIERSWPSSIISFCVWHISRALRRKASEVLGTAAVDDVLQSFYAIREAKSFDEYEEMKLQFEMKYLEKPEWSRYMTNQWFSQPERWAAPFMRDFVQTSRTNNYVESFHATLGRHCITEWGKYRPDHVVYRLYVVLLTSFKSHENRVVSGLEKRAVDKGEQIQLRLAYEVSFDEIETYQMVVDYGLQADVSFDKVSDQDSKTWVMVMLDGSVASCSCGFHERNRVWCKHIFLLDRIRKARGTGKIVPENSRTEWQQAQIDSQAALRAYENCDVRQAHQGLTVLGLPAVKDSPNSIDRSQVRYTEVAHAPRVSRPVNEDYIPPVKCSVSRYPVKEARLTREEQDRAFDCYQERAIRLIKEIEVLLVREKYDSIDRNLVDSNMDLMDCLFYKMRDSHTGRNFNSTQPY